MVCMHTLIHLLNRLHGGDACRWERSGFDAAYAKLQDQLHNVCAEVDAVVGGITVAQTTERHTAAETEVLKAQGDAEQVNKCGCICTAWTKSPVVPCMTLTAYCHVNTRPEMYHEACTVRCQVHAWVQQLTMCSMLFWRWSGIGIAA